MLEEILHTVGSSFVSHDIGWKDTDNVSNSFSEEVVTYLDKMVVPLPIVLPQNRAGGSS